MITEQDIEEAMTASHGTENWYSREPFKALVYTDGVMFAQSKLGLSWLVDMVGTYTPDILQDFQTSGESFYTVKLKVNEDHTAMFTITREVYVKEELSGAYEDFVVAEQKIEYADLPQCELTFFLELLTTQPVTFCLLCPSEH